MMMLYEYDDLWGSTPVDVEVPDGVYQVVVDKVRITESKNGKPIMQWFLIIAHGQYAGCTVKKSNVINENTLKMIKTDIAKLGCGLEKMRLSELPDFLDLAIGAKLEVKVVTDSFGKNVRILSCISPPVVATTGIDGGKEDGFGGEDEAKEDGDEADDVPF